MKTLFRLVLILLVLGVIAAGAVGYTAYTFLNRPVSTSQETTVFEVRPGESFKTIAHRLEEEGLISSSRMLGLYGRFMNVGSKVRVGEYAIPRDSKPTDVLAIITSGKSIEYAVVVPEGYNIFEVADVVQKRGIAKRDEFLALTRDRALIRELLGEDLPSLEGYLFPETYKVTKFTGPRGLVKMMVGRFKENYEKVKALGGNQMKRKDLITLASIIEKETGAPEERPLISSVFHNRMRINMKLQTDPTVIYGIWEQSGIWNRNISKNDLLTPNRYNTYSFTGLPYGPIANPGFDAMKAAAFPAASEYLFFVSKNDGTHIFSKDLAGHLRGVADYQLNAKAREGKSWRDLQKRTGAVTQGSAVAPKSATGATPRPR
jgi:UPF0755 protein